MKRAKILLLTLLFLVLLTACNKSNTDVNEDGEVIIRVWVHVAGDTLEGKAYKNRVDAFNKKYDGQYEARIEFIPRGGGGTGYEDKINAALTTSSLPDVITLDGPNTAAYAASGILIKLDEYISDEVKNDFLPSALDQGMYNGSLYSLAIQESTTVIYYNKSMFVEAGLCESVEACEPKDIRLPNTDQAMGLSLEKPWTFDQFKQIASHLRDYFDIESIMLPTSQDEMITYAMAPFIWTNGGDIVSEDGLNVDGIFNSQSNVETFTFLQSLYTEGIATNIPIDHGFYLGHYPMMLDGIWGVPMLEITYKEQVPYWGVLPIPVGKTGKLQASTGSWAFGVTTQSKHPEIAALFAEWMTNVESTNHITNATGLIPARISALENNIKYQSGVRELLKEQLLLGGHARPVSVAYPEITDAFQRVYIELMVTSNAPNVKEVLDKYTESLQVKLNRHKR